jgi:hypothetical protein
VITLSPIHENKKKRWIEIEIEKEKLVAMKKLKGYTRKKNF